MVIVIYILVMEMLLRVGFSKIFVFDIFERESVDIINTADWGISIVLLVISHAENCG